MGLFCSTTIHKHTVAPAYPQTINRAPTDDSVKLLQEMEAAAREKFLAAFVPEGNTVRGAVVKTIRDDIRADSIIHVRFELNGETYSFEERVDGVLAALDPREATEALYRRLADRIAGMLLGKVRL